MNTTTLRGIFPDPKPVHRRNFIKENVKQIKQMQGLLQEAGVIQPRTSKAKPRERTPEIHKEKASSTSVPKLKSAVKPKVDIVKKKPTHISDIIESDSKVTHRSMQTERVDTLTKLYETGVIKYASAHAVRSNRTSPRKSTKGQGDDEEDIKQTMQSLDLEEKDYVRENMRNLKSKLNKSDSQKVPTKPPPNYQRGVVPKYLRERKEEESKDEVDIDCPPGHILLQEEDRKETLRVLRQSYADRIQELNSMPVRSDTLKQKRRKMEIEEELKKIDGGIKVFQRPKVFVKINS